MPRLLLLLLWFLKVYYRNDVKKENVEIIYEM